jgi:hypothetical protein
MFGTQPEDNNLLPIPTTSLGQKSGSRSQPRSHVGLTTNRTTSSLHQDDDLMFTLEELRSPLVQLSNHMKAKIAALKKRHHKIDNDFLDNRIEPRYVVIVADGHNMKTFEKREVKPWEPKKYSNVTININKFIAKYDYDIAMLICPSIAKRY